MRRVSLPCQRRWPLALVRWPVAAACPTATSSSVSTTPTLDRDTFTELVNERRGGRPERRRCPERSRSRQRRHGTRDRRSVRDARARAHRSRRDGCRRSRQSTAASPDARFDAEYQAVGQAWVTQDSALLADERAARPGTTRGRPSPASPACSTSSSPSKSEAQAVLDRLEAGEAVRRRRRRDLARHAVGSAGRLARLPAAVAPSRQAFIPEFVEGSLAAEIGVPTQPVESQFGQHVIRIAPFEELSQRRRAPHQPGRARRSGTTSRPTPRSARGSGSTSPRSGEPVSQPVPRVVVAGLGPGGVEHVTGETLAADRAHPAPLPAHLAPPERPSRARRGHVRRALRAWPTRFDDVYAEIADRLVAAAVEHGEVLYVVPGLAARARTLGAGAPRRPPHRVRVAAGDVVPRRGVGAARRRPGRDRRAADRRARVRDRGGGRHGRAAGRPHPCQLGAVRHQAQHRRSRPAASTQHRWCCCTRSAHPTRRSSTRPGPRWIARSRPTT